MKGRYQQQADLLLKGLDIVQQYCNISMDFLSGTEFTTNTSDEAIRKANIVKFLINLNKYIMWEEKDERSMMYSFRVFMKGTVEATEYLSTLNDKDPFKKWLEEQRMKSEKKLLLEVFD